MKKQKNQSIDSHIRNILLGLLIVAFLILALPITSNLAYLYLVQSGADVSFIDKDFSMDYVSIVLACFAVCFTLAGVIPYVVSRFITKRDIEEVFDSRFGDSLEATIGSLEKADADHSRMNAFFLLDSGKPTWAIGWMCRAMIKYMRCNKELRSSQGYYNHITKCVFLWLLTLFACLLIM